MKSKLSLPGIKESFFLALLFTYIYAPPFSFVPFGINKLIAPLSILGLLFFFKSSSLKVLTQKHTFIALCFAIASLIYALVMDNYAFRSNLAFTEKYTFNQAMILLEVLPISLFLSIYAVKKLKYTFAQFLGSIVTIAAVQSFIAIFMLLSPKIRMFILTAVLNYDPSEDKIFRPDIFALRIFGMGKDYLFSFAVVQGIAVVCILCLCLYNFTKYKYTLILTPGLLLSIALNARIGFVTIVLFIVITVIFSLSKLRVMFLTKLITYSIISALIIYISVTNLEFFFEPDISQNLEWATEMFAEGQRFASGADTGTGNFGKIRKRHLHLPKTESARFFGEGRYVFKTGKASLSSDVGFVRRIYFGGYIYSLLIYAILIYLFLGIRNKSQKSHSTFVPFLYCILVTAFVCHIKGDIFLPIPGFRIIFMIFLFGVCERRLQLNSYGDRKSLNWGTNSKPNLN